MSGPVSIDPAGRPLRVFLVDDHDLLRRGFAAILDGEPGFEVAGEAATRSEALERLPGARSDLAVLDVRLPDGSGIELCREIRSTLPDIACLVLTAYEDEDALLAAIMAGASAYLLKGSSADELVHALRVVGSGGCLLDPTTTTVLLERIRSGGSAEDERLRSLTQQERRILELIAEGLTNREIAGRIFLTEATVKNYVSRMLSKLGLRGRTQAALLASSLKRETPDG